MKRVWICLYLLGLIVLALAMLGIERPVTAIPEPTNDAVAQSNEDVMLLGDMFAQYRKYPLNELSVIGYAGDNTLLVTFNGTERLVKIKDGSYIMFAVGRGGDRNVKFEYVEISSPNSLANVIGVDCYAFEDGRLILIPKNLGYFDHIVDPMVWDKTKAELVVWEYPGNVDIVENLTTGEVVIGGSVMTFTDSQMTYGHMYQGDEAWGYLHVENIEGGSSAIFLSQSEPDYVKIESFAETVVETDSKYESIFRYGPAFGCFELQVLTDYPKDLIKEGCDVYYFAGF